MRNFGMEWLSFVRIIRQFYQFTLCAPATSTRTEGLRALLSDGREVKTDARQDIAAQNSTTRAEVVHHS